MEPYASESDPPKVPETTGGDESADWRALYPFASHYHPVAGGRLHYLDEGTGQPLLMVHGNPTWSFYWRNLVTAFRGRKRVVAVDHLGCGLSDKPGDYEYSLAHHVANLKSLVESLDLNRIVLLVHDWGGPIGLLTALELAERIDRLVIFNTGAFPPPFIPWRIRVCRWPLIRSWGLRGLNLFPRAALTMATHQPARLTPAVRQGLLAPYDSWANRVAIEQFVRDIPTHPRQPTWQLLQRLADRLPEVFADHPVLLAWGMRDWCFRPSCLERLEAMFPRAQVHRFADAGHYVIEDAHERIIPLVDDFLSA